MNHLVSGGKFSYCHLIYGYTVDLKKTVSCKVETDDLLSCLKYICFGPSVYSLFTDTQANAIESGNRQLFGMGSSCKQGHSHQKPGSRIS